MGVSARWRMPVGVLARDHTNALARGALTWCTGGGDGVGREATCSSSALHTLPPFKKMTVSVEATLVGVRGSQTSDAPLSNKGGCVDSLGFRRTSWHRRHLPRPGLRLNPQAPGRDQALLLSMPLSRLYMAMLLTPDSDVQ